VNILHNKKIWLFTAMVISGCATTPEPESLEPLFFPPPPEQPRFVFERIITGSADLVRDDGKKRWRRLLTGERERGIGMEKPHDVSVCKGRIFVSDSVNRVVQVYDVPAQKNFPIGVTEPGVLIKPLGLATDSECNLYVADFTAKRVNIYDQDGNFTKAIGGLGWFDRLSNVAVDEQQQRIFAVDTGGSRGPNHRIRVFDLGSGDHLYDIGKRGTGDGQFNMPRDVQFGPDGLLYVVDSANFRVQALRPDGTFVKSFGALGLQLGQFARPKGIAIDPDGNIYVSDASYGNFQIFDPKGQLLLFIGGRSATFGRANYMLPAGIHVDEDGRVYMVDQYFRKIDVYRPARLAENEGYLGAGNTPK
jgi:DNA-binding beta-propeller fold protein YncE